MGYDVAFAKTVLQLPLLENKPRIKMMCIGGRCFYYTLAVRVSARTDIWLCSQNAKNIPWPKEVR
jgi:hypothetical protein